MTDAQDHRLVISLAGVETLRVTAVAGGYNANFYMLVPAPVLDISRSATNVIVSWQTKLAGFRLQSTATLTPPNWADVLGPFNVVNGRYTVTNDTLGTALFFRLGR